MMSDTHGRPMRILLVEDERVLCSALAAVFQRRGHAVDVAHECHEALDFEAPEALVADLNLPDASGLDLLAAFQARGSRPHAVIVTGDPSVDSCRRALLLGAAEFLAKPFRVQELVDAVERAPAVPQAPPLDGSSFERAYTPAPGSVLVAARDIVAFALTRGIGPSCRARIGGAVAEIVDNAVRHGRARKPNSIRVRAEITGGDMIVIITDQGIGFDVENLRPDSLDSTLANGLARALALTEGMRIESSPGAGTRAQLRFHPWRSGFHEDGRVDLSELDFLTPDVARRVLHALEKPETADFFQLTPSLAVAVGRMLGGPDVKVVLEPASWGRS